MSRVKITTANTSMELFCTDPELRLHGMRVYNSKIAHYTFFCIDGISFNLPLCLQGRADVGV